MTGIDQTKHIFTGNGMEAALAAAVLLRRYPDAHVHITSERHLHKALRDVFRHGMNGSVYVCGLVPAKAQQKSLLDSCKTLISSYVINWYAKRDPQGNLADKLSARGCVLRWENDLALPYIVALAEGLGRDHPMLTVGNPACLHGKLWREVVEQANRYYWYFADDRWNLRAIQAMAARADREPLPTDLHRFHHRYRALLTGPLLHGHSPVMKTLRRLIGVLGPKSEPVLLTGPSGCGKQTVARSLHVAYVAENGLDGEFVHLSCRGLTEAEAQQRFLGGTDAEGAFSRAQGGTLYLADVDQLPANAQAGLLRIIEDCCRQPLAARPRIIAGATAGAGCLNCDQTFDQELHNQLAQYCLEIPPLRKRMEDLPSIASCVRLDLGQEGLTLRLSHNQDWPAIRAYDWPGDLREFSNVLRQAAVERRPVASILTSRRRHCAVADASLQAAAKRFRPEREHDVVPAVQIQAEYVRHVVQHIFAGSANAAAQALQLSPNTIRKYCRDDG